ncbi:MAG: hypothetical protein NTW86_06330, partial [Candidatus Sumerlaeota bacterium]|nr:hypothetical protein [Candidatus Sumerlaeota bacterium]
GLALGAAAWTGALIRPFLPIDGALLAAVGLGSPVAAASIVRAFRRPARATMIAAPNPSRATAAQARSAYERTAGEERPAQPPASK